MLLADFCQKMMKDMDIEPTPLRVAFITKFEALLCLRSFSIPDPRSLQAAVQVILNFSRCPTRQEAYYKAVIRNLDRMILKGIKKDAYRMRDVTDECWDCPGHVGQVSARIFAPLLHARARVISLTVFSHRSVGTFQSMRT